MPKTRIRYFREKKQLTHQDIAERTGLPKEDIMAYEVDAKPLRLYEAIAIAQALGVSLSELLKDGDKYDEIRH